MNPTRIQLLVCFFLLVHVTISSDDTLNKNATYPSEFQLDQNKEIQFTEDSTRDNNVGNEDEYIIHFILNDDNVTFNCNETQSIMQSGKRTRFNCDQNYFNYDEKIKNVKYAFGGEYDKQFQKQEDIQKRYLQKEEEKIEDGQLSFFNLMKAHENSIIVSKNKNLRNEKIKIPQNIILLDANKTKKRKREHNKRYRETHVDKIKQQTKTYRENHPDKIKEKNKKYYETHADKIKETNKKYYEDHRNIMKECQKKWYQKNADECKEYMKAYHEGHADKINENRKKQYQEKMQSKSKSTKNNITKLR